MIADVVKMGTRLQIALRLPLIVFSAPMQSCLRDTGLGAQPARPHITNNMRPKTYVLGIVLPEAPSSRTRAWTFYHSVQQIQGSVQKLV
ncbi:unnamed protein product [Colias eurytheme]|nr:unnamed protein product [Colias eurytheme]